MNVFGVKTVCVSQKQPKHGRLWLTDGSCIRLRPDYKHHVWSYDFMFDKTTDGRDVKLLNIIDEHSRECLSIDVERSFKSQDVQYTLYELFLRYGVPDYVRSDNGSEFIAKKLRKWFSNIGVKTLFIEPGNPWENGYIELFNGKLRDEFLNRELFETIYEAKVLIEDWRVQYNTVRPHSSLNYRLPAPETVELLQEAC